LEDPAVKLLSLPLLVLALLCSLTQPAAAHPAIQVAQPMSPPTWALLEREVLKASSAACREFFDHYFDERGWLLCVERWGGDDGPDDAIENCCNWPILHALGGADQLRQLYDRAWEGHLRQYTFAKTKDVPFARDGMYYKEFPVMFDWLHNAEGLSVFCMQGLSAPRDERLLRRARRYAGFYLSEDPGAPNYDPKHRVIRSMFNGSRGPLLRRATPLDWAGDPIEIKGRFRLGHGESSYDEMLAHFKDYNDIVCDHPQNLLITSLVLNAYVLSGEAKYRDWILEYVDAWLERMKENHGIIPTKVGLDGKIGGDDGKWYGGVYGWGFSVTVPQTGQLAHRNTHALALAGFGNAYLLTGDARYLDPWRHMIELINAQGKQIDGKMHYPHMFGDRGWYQFTPQKYAEGAEALWYWSMRQEDLDRLPMDGWVAFLQDRKPDYPEAALRADLAVIRQKMAAVRADTTTPDTRLSDDSLPNNPAEVKNLVNLMLGGLHNGNKTLVLHSRVRYFDADRHRAGLPEGVAALVERLTAATTELTLVNIDQLHPHNVVIQAGGHGEHQFTSVAVGDRAQPLNANHLTVRLAPGAGARLVLGTRRYTNRPSLMPPWDGERR
jgi:hypothetical protein